MPYKVRFKGDDDSFVELELAGSINTSGTTIRLKPHTHFLTGDITTPLSVCSPWFNCYSFGNGVESDRIRDDFNSDPIWLYTSSGKQSGFNLIYLSLIRKKNYFQMI